MKTKDTTALENIILQWYASDDENLTNCIYEIHQYYLDNILNDFVTYEEYNTLRTVYQDMKKEKTQRDCPFCTLGKLVEIKGKLFCEDCTREIKEPN